MRIFLISVISVLIAYIALNCKSEHIVVEHKETPANQIKKKRVSTLDNKLDSILPLISKIESNNDDTAIGDNGKAYGRLQIWNIAVQDVNRVYGTKYTHEQMHDYAMAKEVFKLTLKHGIKVYKEKHGVMPKEEDVVRMWNGGVYKGYTNAKTEKYWKKYKKEKEERGYNTIKFDGLQC